MTRKARSCVLISILVFFYTASAFGGCKDMYPDTQVDARLGKLEYTDCRLDVMRADYAKFLQEQARLLTVLRPAYQRQLQEDFDDSQQQIRLSEFDAKVLLLSNIAEALPTATAGQGNASENLGEQVPSVGELLRQGREHSHTLKSKIVLARDELEGDEEFEYCKLDFHFRLRKGLHAKMRDCFSGR